MRRSVFLGACHSQLSVSCGTASREPLLRRSVGCQLLVDLELQAAERLWQAPRQGQSRQVALVSLLSLQSKASLLPDSFEFKQNQLFCEQNLKFVDSHSFSQTHHIKIKRWPHVAFEKSNLSINHFVTFKNSLKSSTLLKLQSYKSQVCPFQMILQERRSFPTTFK